MHRRSITNTSDAVVTTNLFPTNLYESQIVSTLKDYSGQRIVNYILGSAVTACEISTILDRFFAE